VILRETDQSHSSKGIDAMTTAHDIDWPQGLAVTVYSPPMTGNRPEWTGSSRRSKIANPVVAQ
jgi:hypothetical protein